MMRIAWLKQTKERKKEGKCQWQGCTHLNKKRNWRCDAECYDKDRTHEAVFARQRRGTAGQGPGLDLHIVAEA